jgi:membrane protease YdiL (CAAX protease family)
MENMIIAIVKLIMALAILGFIARVPENLSDHCPFFAQHKWTLRDAYRILFCLIAVQFLDAILFAVWLRFLPRTPVVILMSGAVLVIPSIITCCLYYFTISRHYGINVSIFGIDKSKFLKRGLVSANITMILFALLGAFRAIPPLSPGASEWPIGFLLTVAVLGFLGPATEELLFRGILYAPVARRAGKWKAIIALSLVECLMHTNFGIEQSIPQFLFWILLYHIYVRSESLLSPIILHMAFNALSWQPMGMAMMASCMDIRSVRLFWISGPLLALLVMFAFWLAASRKEALASHIHTNIRDQRSGGTTLI